MLRLGVSSCLTSEIAFLSLSTEGAQAEIPTLDLTMEEIGGGSTMELMGCSCYQTSALLKTKEPSSTSETTRGDLSK